MAMKQSIFIASVVLLVILIEQGSGIKCYNCNSNVDIRCGFGLPPSEFIIDCDELSLETKLVYTYCRKLSQVMKFGINELDPDSRVIRECGTNITEVRTECFSRHGISSTQSICECDISYCNGADHVIKSANALFIAVIVILALKLFVVFQH